MAIPTAKVKEIRELAEELMDAADTLIEIREADRADYGPDERADANAEFESAIAMLHAAIPPSFNGSPTRPRTRGRLRFMPPRVK